MHLSYIFGLESLRYHNLFEKYQALDSSHLYIASHLHIGSLVDFENCWTVISIFRIKCLMLFELEEAPWYSLRMHQQKNNVLLFFLIKRWRNRKKNSLGSPFIAQFNKLYSPMPPCFNVHYFTLKLYSCLRTYYDEEPLLQRYQSENLGISRGFEVPCLRRTVLASTPNMYFRQIIFPRRLFRLTRLKLE